MLELCRGIGADIRSATTPKQRVDYQGVPKEPTGKRDVTKVTAPKKSPLGPTKVPGPPWKSSSSLDPPPPSVKCDAHAWQNSNRI